MKVAGRLGVFALGVVGLTLVGRTVMGIHGLPTSSPQAQVQSQAQAQSQGQAQQSNGQAQQSSGQSQAVSQGVSSNGATDSGATTQVYDLATPHSTPIPSEALRLRIIANSDSTQDQDTKRAVRDAVVVQVAKIVSGSKSEEQAQQRVIAALPQLRDLAQQVAEQRGYHYAVHAVVGKEPFPTKLYGNQVYPAGSYNALVITLGSGQGQNWWCVLFPPLCFVDIADGDAVPNTAGFPDLPPLETITVPSSNGTPEQVQVRLATLDYGEEAWKALKRWF